jgi:hypothetical protein
MEQSMGMVKVHVWHDVSGKIVAVGQPVGSAKCIPVAGDKHIVLEIEAEESQISSLHRTHTIDPLRKVMVKIPEV